MNTDDPPSPELAHALEVGKLLDILRKERAELQLKVDDVNIRMR